MVVIISFIAATFVLWFVFANVMALKTFVETRMVDGITRDVVRAIGYAIAFVGLLYDIAYNWTWGSLMFWERPYKRTFTSRLKHHVSGTGWRQRLAAFICRYLVEPWDKGHCGQ